MKYSEIPDKIKEIVSYLSHTFSSTIMEKKGYKTRFMGTLFRNDGR